MGSVIANEQGERGAEMREVDPTKISKDNIAEALARFKQSIGKSSSLGTKNELFGRRNEAATKDAIRHFANGIGDPNPLWRDEEYARNTRYGGIIAPPLFVNAIALAMGGMPMSGFTTLVAGAEWEWFRRIHLNDTITVTDGHTDIVNKTRADGTGPKQFLQIGRMVYRNQRDDVVAICKRMLMLVEKSAMTRKISENISETRRRWRYSYTNEELEAIDRAYEEEEIRGADQRYWEDVKEGEELKPVVKGPLTHGDMLAFVIGVGWIDEAHGLARPLFRKYPEFTYHDPETGIVEWRFIDHFVDPVGRDSVLPRAIGLGIQACCWLGHLVTNWMGDDGFLKKLEAQCRGIIFFGDTTWCKGKVIRKYVENNEYLVDCEIWSENQKGEITTPGHATVALPSKSLGT